MNLKRFISEEVAGPKTDLNITGYEAKWCQFYCMFVSVFWFARRNWSIVFICCWINDVIWKNKLKNTSPTCRFLTVKMVSCKRKCVLIAYSIKTMCLVLIAYFIKITCKALEWPYHDGQTGFYTVILFLILQVAIFRPFLALLHDSLGTLQSVKPAKGFKT